MQKMLRNSTPHTNPSEKVPSFKRQDQAADGNSCPAMEAEAPWAVHAGAASLHGLCQQLSVRQGSSRDAQAQLRLSSC